MKDNSLRIVLQPNAQAGTSHKKVGAAGFEPATVASEGVENKRLREGGKPDANVYANTSPKNPLEKLAEAWETLTPEVQAKLAELIEKASEKA